MAMNECIEIKQATVVEGSPRKELRKHCRKLAAMPSLPFLQTQSLDNTPDDNSLSTPEPLSPVKQMEEQMPDEIKQSNGESPKTTHRYGRSSDASQYSKKNVRPSRIRIETVKRTIDDISKDIDQKLKIADSQPSPDCTLSPKIRIGMHSKKSIPN